MANQNRVAPSTSSGDEPASHPKQNDDQAGEDEGGVATEGDESGLKDDQKPLDR